MIQAKDLIKKFGSLTAVDGLSLSINDGETFGLLGPNGAGKSTTIGMLVGLIRPDDGTVTVGERALSPSIPEVRRCIGVAPQTLSLYADLTAKENLAFFGGLYGMGSRKLKQRIEWGLEFAGLEDRRNDRISTFSGGMKRRMNIAVALIHEPEMLLLDEPTVGVDPQSRNHIFDRIEELQRDGLTILYTTHYMEEAQRLCDRVAIMDKGKLLALDSVDGLLQKYGGSPVVTASLHPDSKTDDLPGEFSNGAIRFESQQPIEDVAALTNRGVRFQNLQIANSDLESVFLELTGRSLRD